MNLPTTNPKRLPDQDYVDAIEASFDLDNMPPSASPERMKEVEAAALEALQSLRGGARPGAGRPRKDHIQRHFSLAVSVDEKITEVSQREGISRVEVVERAVRATYP